MWCDVRFPDALTRAPRQRARYLRSHGLTTTPTVPFPRCPNPPARRRRSSSTRSARPSAYPRSARARSRSVRCTRRRRSRHESFEALRDISFDVRRGEFFGIVGRNGSGKSTLLKCLAGIYGVDRGRIWMDGRSTFIELGVGFNPDLAARDNVILNGIMMGLSSREARRRVDEVIDFGRAREFEELKLKNYSSGMHVRLAPRRDPGRRRRAARRRGPRRRRRRLPAEVLRRLPPPARRGAHDRVRNARHGLAQPLLPPRPVARARATGAPRSAPRGGRPVPRDQLRAQRRPERRRGRRRRGVAAAATARRACSRRGSRTSAASAPPRAPGPARRPEGARALRGRCRGPRRERLRAQRGPRRDRRRDECQGRRAQRSFAAGEEVLCSFALENVLAPGRYNPLFTIAHRGTGMDLMDRIEGAFSLVVTGPEAMGGAVDLPARRGRHQPQRRPSLPGTSPPAGSRA